MTSIVLQCNVVLARAISSKRTLLEGERVRTILVVVGPNPLQQIWVRQHGAAECLEEQLCGVFNVSVTSVHAVLRKQYDKCC